MVKSYKVVLKTLLAHKLVTLPRNSRPYDPPIKLGWWRNEDFKNCHRRKGHNTKNCFKLKDVIQDLINGGKVVTDDLVKKL